MVVCAQVKSGLALKICIPLMSSTTKQTALTQWQTRTSTECLTMSRPSDAARADRPEESDVNSVSNAGRRLALQYVRANRHVWTAPISQGAFEVFGDGLERWSQAASIRTPR